MKSISVDDAMVTGSKYVPAKIEDGSKKVEGRCLVTFDLGDRPELIAELAAMGKNIKLSASQIQATMTTFATIPGKTLV